MIAKVAIGPPLGNQLMLRIVRIGRRDAVLCHADEIAVGIVIVGRTVAGCVLVEAVGRVVVDRAVEDRLDAIACGVVFVGEVLIRDGGLVEANTALVSCPEAS